MNVFRFCVISVIPPRFFHGTATFVPNQTSDRQSRKQMTKRHQTTPVMLLINVTSCQVIFYSPQDPLTFLIGFDQSRGRAFRSMLLIPFI